MTSGNDPGQGTRSATTEIDDELEKTHVREGTSPGAEPSNDAADPAAPEAPAEDTESTANAPEAVADEGDAAEKSAGETVTERIAEKTAPDAAEALDAPAEAPATGSAPTTAAEPEAAAKPIPNGFWRSAYEAGAGAPSSRYTTDSTASSNGSPESPVPSLGSAIENAAASPRAEADDIEDTTRPRNVPRETPPPTPPGDAWQRVPAPQAHDVPVAEPEAAASANETTGQGRGGDDQGAAVKLGAVKAAQAALAAARNAAKKVSSAMPETPAAPATEPPTVPPTPPEMHYTAGAVRGSASVPVEETVPVGPSGMPEGDTTPGPAPSVAPRAGGGPRRVRLAISRIDPWSVMKLAFLLSVAIAIMTVVAAVVFWSVIDSLGVFDNVQTFVTDAIGDETNFNVMQYVEFERVVSLATLVAICNVVLLTALATIMTFLYNITAALVGGVHMTLTDD